MIHSDSPESLACCIEAIALAKRHPAASAGELHSLLAQQGYAEPVISQVAMPAPPGAERSSQPA